MCCEQTDKLSKLTPHVAYSIVKIKNKKIKTNSPIIISASRATDIPAYYSDWLINRLKEGFVIRKNPFNQKPYKISFDNTRLIVFWTKNPEPLMQKLDWFDDKFPNYYFQFTLNDYNRHIEPNMPVLQKRIETFIKLSERIGKEKVIWRFDPLLLTENISVDDLLRKIENVAEQVSAYTEKMVFSFADIQKYRSVRNNLKRAGISAREFSEKEMLQTAKGISEIIKRLGIKAATCAEEIDLSEFGILHNKCIDDELILKLFSEDVKLMNFLGVKKNEKGIFVKAKKNLKDKGQRKLCKCISSKDIGDYNTCPAMCAYCYANSSKKLIARNFKSL